MDCKGEEETAQDERIEERKTEEGENGMKEGEGAERETKNGGIKEKEEEIEEDEERRLEKDKEGVGLWRKKRLRKKRP